MPDPMVKTRTDRSLGVMALAVAVGGTAFGCGAKRDPAPAAQAARDATAAGDDAAAPANPDPAPPLREVAADPQAPDDPASFCDQVRALQGNWTFTATVVGARVQAPVGAHAAYALAVSTDGCEASAELRSVDPGKEPGEDPGGARRAEAKLVSADGLGVARAATGTFTFAPADGAEGGQVFAFVVRGDRLYGYWYDTGEPWERAGLSGVLTGARGEARSADVEALESQPCALRCVVGCDTARRRADGTHVQADLDACVAGCASPDAPASCGEAPPLAAGRVLKLHGPRTNLGQHCNVFLDEAIAQTQAHPDELEFGCKSTIEFGGTKSPTLQADALGGSFEVVRLFETGHNLQGYAGEVRVALMTKAGWYVSDPLLDSSAAGLQEHAFESLDLYARELADSPGKEVVAVLSNRVTQPNPEDGTARLDASTMTVACRAGEEGAPPRCVALRTAWRSAKHKLDDEASKPLRDEQGGLDVSFLPGGRVSIGAGDGGAKDPLVGIWTW